jgi:hypothetical protein
MSSQTTPDDRSNDQEEIVRLLDERYRLREDPERQEELLRTHDRLRELLRPLSSEPPPDIAGR